MSDTILPRGDKNSFPSHLINPEEKGRDWILQYCKAAWDSFERDVPREIFYHARYRMEVEKQYAHGNQSFNKYKPLMGIDEDDDESWLNIDWSIIPIVPKFRRIALGKLNKVDYNIVATPVDSQATEETNQYFANIKAKLLIREKLMKINPDLLDSPALRLDEKDAKDLDELEMQMKYTHKHQMAIEAEQGIELIFAQNNLAAIRETLKENWFDHGVAGYKEWIDSNGAVKIRAVEPRNVIVANCKRRDFKDSPHIGEITEMTISDLKQAAQGQFTEDEYEQIAKNVIGLYGNPKEWPSSMSIYNKGYDRFKIRVLDLQFYSVNEMVHEKRVDRRGNKIYGRAKYEDRNKRKDKFDRTAYKVVYKGKWIINTNYIFDYGLLTDMKRSKSSLMDTTMEYHLFASEFWDMRAYGTMHQIIPIADALQIAWYRLQNAINQARPKGIQIEMGTLEDIPLGAGGKKLTPLKVLDLYNKTGTLVYRKNDTAGRVSNYKPIEELENGLGKDVMNYWQIIQNNIQLLRDITGINEMTDGSTPDPRTLTTVAKLAYEGTSNALAHISSTDKFALEELANSVILRLQDTVSRGTAKGYIRPLGSNTLKFIEVSEKVSMYEYGIILEDKPTDEQRQRLLQQVAYDQQSGQLDVESAVIIENTSNLKVAQQLLAHMLKKNRERQQREAMQQQQMNGQIQQQSAMVAEQAKQQTIQVEGQIKAEIEKIKVQGQKELLELKYKYELQLEEMRLGGKAVVKHMENTGKESIERMRQGGQPSVVPQPLANEEPEQGETEQHEQQETPEYEQQEEMM